MDNIDYDGDGEEIPPSYKLRRPSELGSWPPFLHEKKPWKLWSPFVNEYNKILENPKTLPSVLQPFLSKDRQFTFGIPKPYKRHFLNIQIDTPDERWVKRRVYFHICKENFFVGSVSKSNQQFYGNAATLIGVSTGFFTPASHRLAPILANRKLVDKSFFTLARMAFSGTLITATFMRRLVFRSVLGGLLYDAVKRNRDEKDYLNQWMNAGYSGTISGLIFGIRGGLPHAWAAAAISSTTAVLSEFLPWPFSDSDL